MIEQKGKLKCPTIVLVSSLEDKISSFLIASKLITLIVIIKNITSPL
jgi:hypothetical protein